MFINLLIYYFNDLILNNPKTKNIFRFTRAWVYICYFSDKWVSSHDIKILKLCQNERKVKSIFIFTINDLKKAKKAFLMGANVVLSDSLK